MHSQTNLINVLVFGDNDFINSLEELKEYFKFNLVIEESNQLIENFNKYDVLLVHQIYKNFSKLNHMKIYVSEAGHNENNHSPNLKLPTSQMMT